jgi:AcrR family transcriptional regulator
MSLADDLVERSLNKRQAAYTIEVRQIIDATYRVIAKTDSFDPPVRSILREAKLSSPAFYRHFRSKDELLLVMLDEGRRKLVGYLAHRIDAATSAGERVAEWVRGVLAQAGDPTAARLTRPFVTEVERLHEQFPEEQRASEELLLRQLADLLDDGQRRWVRPIYSMVFGELARHLRTDTPPTHNEVETVVSFVLAGIGKGRT